MASASAGSSRDTTAPPPVAVGAPSNAANGAANNAPVDTAQLERLVEKALKADKNGRYSLAAGFFRRAVDEALRLHGETFVSTFLTLQRASSLRCQLFLEGVTPDEILALNAEAWALASSCLPLIIRRMDANTMLPGRGTAVELAFFKWFEETKIATYDAPPMPIRSLQLLGLSLGYATAVLAADVLIGIVLPFHHDSYHRPFFFAWWTACCQPLEAWQTSRSDKRPTLHQFKILFLACFPGLTRRLSPYCVQNGRMRRWCRCAGNVAC